MDGVPFAFFDHLIALLHVNTLSKAKELSGTFGELAQYAFEHTSTYICTIRDGYQVSNFLYYRGSKRYVDAQEEIAAAPSKFVRILWIYLQDAEAENVSRQTVQLFPYAHEYNFGLESSSITEAWVALVYSLKRLGHVWILKKLDNDSLLLFKKLVTGRKLSYLMIHPDAYEDDMMLQIRNKPARDWTTAPVRELLEFWAQNPEKLRGKYLNMRRNCRSGIDQLEEFLARRIQVWGMEQNPSVLQKALEVCSKEECDFIAKEYRTKFVFEKPSCIYKFEDESGGSKRRFYMAFECASDVSGQQWRRANHNGHNDRDLMRITSFISLMFA
uniref:RNA-directed RNA polymerase n=1 Tax=Steinernema glaseri TaxID=37863 RepID=A0A1I7YH86_9BILA